MNIKQAYKILGLEENASEEDIKKTFKKKAAKLHPDVNKEPSAEKQFKELNEAFQTITEYKSNPSPFGRQSNEDFGFGGISFEDIFNMGNAHPRAKIHNNTPINVNIEISFKESILGTDKDISFNKNAKCKACNGKGDELIGNGCPSCDGFGRIVVNNRNMIFTSSCSKCFGKNIKTKACGPCNSTGVIEVNSKATLHIPPGTSSSTLGLRGCGHFMGTGVFGDAYADVHVNVSVIPDQDLKLMNNDVISNINISLLEALTGCSKEIRTIFDTRSIDIPKLSKNKDEIILKECGVKGTGGVQRVILDIDYPNNIDQIINILKEE